MSVLRRISLAPSVLRAAAMDRAAHTFAKLRYLMPDAHPSRFDVVVTKDVSYTGSGDPAHALDVYIPTRAPKPLPVVMYVHGGGFCMLSKDTHRVMALALARRGSLVFNINYRMGRRHPYPTPLEDASRALLWVAAHCARFGGDPSRLAIAGESAGGNLVTALAVLHAYRRPEPFARRVFDAGLSLRAVIATYGFLDLGHTAEYLKNPKLSPWVRSLLFDAAKMYVGITSLAELDQATRAMPLASPLRIIEAHAPDRPLPPFFVSVGTKDPLLRCSKRLKAALDAKGVRCDLQVAPGEIHGYDAMMWRPSARAKWKAATAFLAEHLAEAPDEDGDVRLGA